MSDASWHRVIKRARLKRESRYVWVPPGQSLAEAILLLYLPSEALYAVSAQCPHQAFSLERGYVDPDALTLECPLHRWVFSLDTGAGVTQGGCLKTYATRMAEDWIWVRTPLADHL